MKLKEKLMKKFKLFITLFLLSYVLQAQENKCLKTINDQIWSNFTKAFETFDYELFSSLHSENLVRVQLQRVPEIHNT